MNNRQLMSMAQEARKNCYTPYSGYNVGAALLAKDGRVFLGCNIESGVHTPTICAERTAYAKAVSEGVREFDRIAIVGGHGDSLDPVCAPCGVCRQVMSEFSSDDFVIVLGTPDNHREYTLAELLPLAFHLK